MFSEKTKGKVFVGLSGGVDSAVSAALLQKEGYDVTGVFIRIAIPDYPCTAGEDKIDAQRVAAHLRIPFFEIDLSKEYEEEVFRASIKEFKAGNTPNPDTLCNEKIKFGAFYNFAKSHGADFIATGHYARVQKEQVEASLAQRDGASGSNFQQEIMGARRDFVSVELLAGLDKDKDQSYFLWMVPQEALNSTLFPIGNLQKSQVRELAKKFGLPNASRKDSQGLCFLSDISIEDMLERELTLAPGKILSEEGEVVGTHRGAARYTIGQRHGFELTEQTGVPHFVVAKDAKQNTITVSTSAFPHAVSKTRLMLAHTNWIGEVVDGTYQARFRYRQKLIPVQLNVSKDGAEATLLEPHYVPLGQSLVIYDNEKCLGGGVITNSSLQN